MKMKQSKCYMLDTSAVIDDPMNIVRLSDGGENGVFINNVVYGELNNLKKGKRDAAFPAREFFRLIKDTPIKILKKKEIPPCVKKKIIKRSGDRIIQFKIKKDGEETDFYSIIRKRFRAIEGGDKSMGDEINDLCISEVALGYKMNLITSDNGLFIEHQIAGGQAEFINNNSFEEPNNQTFLHDITVPSGTLNRDDKGNLTSNLIDFIGLQENGNEYTNFTQFKFIEVGVQTNEDDSEIEYKTGKVEFGIKIGQNIEIVDFNSESDDYVMKNSILNHKNYEQGLYYYSLVHDLNQITAVSGSTGSGKTLLAVAAGLELIKKGKIEGIVYTRNTVTASDSQSELGFRKGGEDVKLGYFMSPLYSAINVILDNMKTDPSIGINSQARYTGDTNSFNKEDATDTFMRDNNIEVVDIAHLRGININNKLVILDEGQNLSPSGLKLTGTRSGENVRFLILGDGNQIDHPFLSKYRNALASMMSKAHGDNKVAGFKLKHTVRSDVAEWFDQNL